MSKLVKDWFNRRAEDAYTFNDDSKRFFNWDKDRSSYSSYFIRNDDSLKEASKMIGSMFRVIGVPKTFDYVAAEPSKNTQIQIPIHMLKDEDGKYREPDPEILDAFYGAAIQNAALATMQTTQEYNKNFFFLFLILSKLIQKLIIALSWNNKISNISFPKVKRNKTGF